MLVLMALIWTVPALAEEAALEVAAEPTIVEGEAIALDGDTVVLEGRRLRLWGIDAPEMSDPRGPVGRAALDALLRRGPLRCVLVDKVDSQLPVARCSVPGPAGPEDLGELQLAGGHAFVHRLYTLGDDWAGRYDAAERHAIEGGAGFWSAEQDQADENALTVRWWLEQFFGLLIGLLAVGAAAWTARAIWRSAQHTADAQTRINERRVKLDLFERRLVIYDTAMSITRGFFRLSTPHATELVDRLDEFFPQVQFLFAETGVRTLLEQIQKKARLYRLYSNHIVADRNGAQQHPKFEEWVSTCDEIESWMVAQQKELTDMLGPDLDLRND
ncbi:thermonuclease family protein [Algihabitans albus]|uniref:thermonuclease family protein n=1 Tax=Algihabitans albus TaxID=2164067 RepID=UPI000E5D23A3|nr:thermonuclease family protein [Algihabitans albus]